MMQNLSAGVCVCVLPYFPHSLLERHMKSEPLAEFYFSVAAGFFLHSSLNLDWTERPLTFSPVLLSHSDARLFHSWQFN